jgi:hypothetical protein
LDRRGGGGFTGGGAVALPGVGSHSGWARGGGWNYHRLVSMVLPGPLVVAVSGSPAVVLPGVLAESNRAGFGGVARIAG